MPAHIGLVVDPAGEAVFGTPVIMYDSRNWDGGTNIPNEGDGGTVWDLPFSGQNQTQFWGRKRNNWYAQADTVGPFPSSFTDLNGDWCANGFVHVTALPHAIRRWDGTFAECEWFINALDEFGISLGFTGYGNYFSEPLADPGTGFAAYGKVFSDTNLGDDGSYHEWYPSDEFFEGFSSGAIGAVIAGALIVTYLDPANADSATWIVTSKEVRLVAEGVDDDTHTQFLVACTYDSGGTGMDRMFWQFGYHAHYPPYPGTEWNGVIAQALFRESNRPSAARMRIWYDYFFDTPVVDVLGVETDQMATTKALAVGYAIDYRSVIVVDDNTLVKFDASVPHRPAWRNQRFDADLANAVDCVMDDSGVYAFVATTTNTVRRFQTSLNPPGAATVLTDATNLPTPSAMCGDTAVHYCRTRLFVVASGRITCVNRSTMTVQGSIDVNATGRPCHYYNQDIADGHVLTPDTNGDLVVLLYDISLQTFSTVATFSHAALTGPIAVEVNLYSSAPDTHAFVLNSDSSIVAIDLATPSSPSVVSTLTTSITTPRRLFLRGNQLIVVGDGEVGFVDVAVPTDLTEIGTATTVGIGIDPAITVALDHLWVGIDDTSLTSYSLTGEGAASSKWSIVDDLTQLPDTDTVGGLVKVGNYLYVANRSGSIDGGVDGGLVTVDATTPTALAVVDALSHANLDSARDVAYDGTYVYVMTTDSQDRVTVVDISTPTAPSVLASVDTTGTRIVSITIDGSYAYVCDFDGDAIIVIDISTPSAPVVDNTLTDAANLAAPARIAIVGNYAYVACYGESGPFDGGRLTIVDITDPTAPSVEGSFESDAYFGSVSDGDGGPEGILVSPSGDWAFVASDGLQRLAIIDTSTKTAPTGQTTVNLDQTATTGRNLQGAGGLAWVDTDRIAVAGGSGQGLATVNVADPTSPFIEDLWDSLIGDAPSFLTQTFWMVEDGGYFYGTSFSADSVWVAQYA
jgi:hypothetical protein